MNSSPSIAQLAEALSCAQSEMEAARKDSANPYFQSKYADLASIWEACRGPLGRHGLAVIQLPESIPETVGITITTMLVHSSGEWISSQLKMTPVKEDPQSIGSTITYARRYALAAAVGIAPEDDDANAATGKKSEAVTESSKVFVRKPGAITPTRAVAPTAISNTPPPVDAPIPPDGPELPEYIDHKSQVEFASLFRESLPAAHRREAETLRHHWLGMRGYVDGNGNPTSQVIPRRDFVVVKRMGAQWAREYSGAMPTL